MRGKRMREVMEELTSRMDDVDVARIQIEASLIMLSLIG
jgi:hypothetical protein